MENTLLHFARFAQDLLRNKMWRQTKENAPNEIIHLIPLT